MVKGRSRKGDRKKGGKRKKKGRRDGKTPPPQMKFLIMALAIMRNTWEIAKNAEACHNRV